KGIEQLAMCLGFGSPTSSQFELIDSLLQKRETSFEVQTALSSERAMWFTTLNQPNVVRILAWNSRTVRPSSRMMNGIYDLWLQAVASPAGKPILLKAQIEFLKEFDRFAPKIDDPNADPDRLALEIEEHDRTNTLRNATNTGEE